MSLRILHVLDHSIPLHSGYTFRTLAILKEQRRLGWETLQLTSSKHYGATADERPLVAVRSPVPIMDLHATILTAMGISPTTAFEIERRPFYVTQDGKGKPVMDVFS